MGIPILTSWWGRRSLRVKMVLVAGLPLMAVAAAVPILANAHRDLSRVSDAVTDAYEVRAGLDLVLQDLVDAESWVRAYLLTRDARFLQSYRGGAGSVRGDFVRLRSRLAAAPAPTQGRLDLLADLIDDRLRILRAGIRFAQHAPPGEIPETLLSEGKATMDRIRGTVGELHEEQTLVLERRREERARAERTSMALSVIVVPLALLASIAAVLMFASMLVRRVRQIEENARRLETGELLNVPPPGTDEVARLATSLAHTAARLAEQQAALRELALVDPLTGLHNRRAFMELADHEMAVCRRTDRDTTLLYIDLDHLKLVNDRHGHAEGDRLIYETANLLRHVFRGSDIVARIGGDEFCVLLARDTESDGAAALQRLDGALGERNARGDLPHRIELSVGIASCDPGAPHTIDDLIADADRAMYRQKLGKRPVAV